MSWKDDYLRIAQGAHGLSDIQDLSRLVELAETVGKGLVDRGASAKQMRGFLSETNSASMRIRTGRSLGQKSTAETAMDTAARTEAGFLNASLAYAAGRDTKAKGSMEDLALLVRSMSGHVHTLDDFKVLRKFAEAIAAYFKFHGGK